MNFIGHLATEYQQCEIPNCATSYYVPMTSYLYLIFFLLIPFLPIALLVSSALNCLLYYSHFVRLSSASATHFDLSCSFGEGIVEPINQTQKTQDWTPQVPPGRKERGKRKIGAKEGRQNERLNNKLRTINRRVRKHLILFPLTGTEE